MGESLQREYLDYLYENGVPDDSKRKKFDKEFDNNAKSINTKLRGRKNNNLCEEARYAIINFLKELEPIPSWIQNDSKRMKVFKELKNEYKKIHKLRYKRICIIDYLEWLNNKVIPMNLNYKEAWEKYGSYLRPKSQKEIINMQNMIQDGRFKNSWIKDNSYAMELADKAAEYFNNNNRSNFEISIQKNISFNTTQEFQRAYLHYLYEEGITAYEDWEMLDDIFNKDFEVSNEDAIPIYEDWEMLADILNKDFGVRNEVHIEWTARKSLKESLKEIVPIPYWIQDDLHEMRIFEKVKKNYEEQSEFDMRKTYLTDYLEWINKKVISAKIDDISIPSNYFKVWKISGTHLPLQIIKDIREMEKQIRKGNFPRWFKEDPQVMENAKNAQKYFTTIELEYSEIITDYRRTAGFLEWVDQEVIPFGRNYEEACEVYVHSFSTQIQEHISQIKRNIENGRFHNWIQHNPRLFTLAHKVRNYKNNSPANWSAVTYESATKIKPEQVQEESVNKDVLIEKMNLNYELERQNINYNDLKKLYDLKTAKCQHLEKELELCDKMLSKKEKLIKSKDQTIFKLKKEMGIKQPNSSKKKR